MEPELWLHLTYALRGVGLAGLALLLGRHAPGRRWFRRLMRGVAAVGWVGAAVVLLPMARPRPAAFDRQLAPGLSYHRRVHGAAVTHWAWWDRRTSGLCPVVTPPEPAAGHQVRGQTTSTFVRAHGALLAVNASYFYPWRATWHIDVYPRPGEPVSAVGPVYARGERLEPNLPDPAMTSIWFVGDREVGMGAPPASTTEAVSGFPLVADGQVASASHPSWTEPQPRTALGLADAGARVVFVVVDGRQPGYSRGLSAPQLANLLLEAGVTQAILLDGGGSSTMVDGSTERARLLSTPVHGRIPPGVERTVAIHVGVRSCSDGQARGSRRSSGSETVRR